MRILPGDASGTERLLLGMPMGKAEAHATRMGGQCGINFATDLVDGFLVSSTPFDGVVAESRAFPVFYLIEAVGIGEGDVAFVTGYLGRDILLYRELVVVQTAEALNHDELQTKQLQAQSRVVEYAVGHPPHRFIQLVEHLVEALEVGGEAEKGLGASSVISQ